MDDSHSLEARYDKLLYSLKSLSDMGETISGVRSIEKAAKEILHNVMGTLGASKGALLTLEGSSFVVTAARGVEAGSSYAASEDLLGELRNTKSTLLQRWESEFPEMLKRFCDESFASFTVVLAVVLRAQKRVVGLLLLSRRFMDQDYTDEDLRVLDLICRHVSVALYNFNLRRNVQTANFQLSRKVLQLESLHDIGLSVASFKPKDEMMLEVLYGSMSLLDAQKAFYLETEGGKLTVGSSVGVGAEKLSKFISTGLSNELLSGRSLQLRSSPIIDEMLDSPTLLAVPVRTSNRLYGALAVAGKESGRGEPSFSNDDEKLLSAFATQVAVSLENWEMQKAVIEQERMKQELETAAAIQRLMVRSPEDLPSFEGFKIYGHNYPCKEIGGDYFDVIPISDEAFGFVMCDVSGKGLPAALLVSTLQATFHALFRSNLTLIDIADRANRLLYSNTTSDKFASGFIGLVNMKDFSIETVNAGHNEPLLLRATGQVEKLKAGGFCFGMFDYSAYSSQKSELLRGDTIYLYTDGISEAFTPDGEEFGEKRLEDYIVSKLGLSPEELLRGVEEVVREWTGHTRLGEGFAHDDFTQLAIQRIG